MKKYFFVAIALLIAIVFTSAANAQNRVALPLTAWRYQNGVSSMDTHSSWTNPVGDTLTNAIADTVTIGLLSAGRLAPVAVTVSFEVYEASGNADTIAMTYAIGNGGFYTTIGSAVNEYALANNAMTTTKEFATRTFVFNTTGAAVANNTQGTVSPHGDALRIRLAQPTNTTSTVPFRIRAFGIYEKQ